MSGRELVPLALVAAVLALVGSPDAAEGTASHAGGTAPLADDSWLVFSSNRDGKHRPYSILTDGSRLTPLRRPGAQLVAVAVSQNGKTIAYKAGERADSIGAIYVSSGSGRRFRLARRNGLDLALSRDGGLLAVVPLRGGISLVRSDGRLLRRLRSHCPCWSLDWAPDRKALAFGGARQTLVVLPLHGKRRVIARTGPNNQFGISLAPKWSPDGRWISYLNLEDAVTKNGLYLVRPDGSRRHRLFRAKVFDAAWSPDGKRLALVFGSGDVAVVGIDGRSVKRLNLTVTARAIAWSPDGRRLAIAAWPGGEDAEQIFVANEDGSHLRRLTNEGANSLAGWTRRAPVLPPAAPIPPTEQVLDGRTVATRAPVTALSADGPRVALVPKTTATDCIHAAVWAPSESSIMRFVLPAPCSYSGPLDVALAGSRAAWASYGSERGGDCGFVLKSATLAEPRPLYLHDVPLGAYGGWCAPDYYHLRGDGDLLVFNDHSFDQRWRLARIGGGTEACQDGAQFVARVCATLRRGQNSGPVDSVSGGLIAVRNPSSVEVLDERGQIVRLFPFSPADVRAARLDGTQLVVWRFASLEAYDVATGALVRSLPVPAGFRLVDVDSGVSVLVGGESITLLRLADGTSRTLSPGRAPVLAELEPAGLYLSYAVGNEGRVAFLPRAEADPARRAG